MSPDRELSREQPAPQQPAPRLDQLLADAATRHPDRVAVVDGSARLGYADLDRAVTRTADLLRRRGVAPGDAVALDCRNGAEFAECYYAVLRAGAVVVPLNVLVGERLLAERLVDSMAVLLICVVAADGVPAAETARAAVERAGSCDLLLVDAANPLSRLTADCAEAVVTLPHGGADPAVVTYPRRGPGSPKGVVLSHRAMVHDARAATTMLYGEPSAEVHLVVLPLFHVVAQTFQLNAAVADGATLVLMLRFEPLAALELMAAEGVTALVASPSMLWALAGAAAEHPEPTTRARTTLRTVSSQLAPLPAGVRLALAEHLGVDVLEGFGHSETGMVGLHARPGDTASDSVGTPAPGTQVRLVDADGTEVVGDGTGEVWLSGPGLMSGYLRDPVATDAALRDGWYRTGVTGRREADGHFVLVDRPTHMVMRGGHAIYRRAVEEALLTHPAISDAKSVAVPHAQHGEELRTVIERDPRSVVSEAELVQWAREQMPGLSGTELEVALGDGDPSSPRRLLYAARRLLPGVAFAVAGTAVAFLVNVLVPFLSPLTAGVLLGVILANVGLVPARARPGMSVTTRRLLRAGVVLLGLQLSLPELAGLGLPLLVVVAVTVVLGFVGTRWAGRRLGLPPGLSVLTAAGFSICGASAIAAMEGTSEADEDEVATSIALVTIFGTIALFCWPLLQRPLGLPDEAYGAWAGASVHEVAQVVAAASPAGAAALATAVVVKLARVVMLAPLVAAVAVAARRRSGAEHEPGTRRPPLVPLFVLGFLVMVLVRSADILPSEALDAGKMLTTALLAAALFGLGVGVRVRVLLATGPRAIVLGAASTVAIAVLAYLGVLLAVFVVG